MVIELDLATCCDESNGQGDEEADIDHVSWFDNANFSSPIQSKLQSETDHKNLNRDTCYAQLDSINIMNKEATPLQKLSDLALGHRKFSLCLQGV